MTNDTQTQQLKNTTKPSNKNGQKIPQLFRGNSKKDKQQHPTDEGSTKLKKSKLSLSLRKKKDKTEENAYHSTPGTPKNTSKTSGHPHSTPLQRKNATIETIPQHILNQKTTAGFNTEKSTDATDKEQCKLYQAQKQDPKTNQQEIVSPSKTTDSYEPRNIQNKERPLQVETQETKHKGSTINFTAQAQSIQQKKEQKPTFYEQLSSWQKGFMLALAYLSFMLPIIITPLVVTTKIFQQERKIATISTVSASIAILLIGTVLGSIFCSPSNKITESKEEETAKQEKIILTA